MNHSKYFFFVVTLALLTASPRCSSLAKADERDFAAYVHRMHAPKQQDTRWSLKPGVGYIKTLQPRIKTLAIRREDNVDNSPFFDQAIEAGTWQEGKNDAGRKSTWYGQYQIGVRVESLNFYAKCFAGVAGLSITDSQLGGLAQFAEDFSIGFQDSNSFIGLNYGHKSSGRIFTPNRGRDLITLEIGIKL